MELEMFPNRDREEVASYEKIKRGWGAKLGMEGVSKSACIHNSRSFVFLEK